MIDGCSTMEGLLNRFTGSFTIEEANQDGSIQETDADEKESEAIQEDSKTDTGESKTPWP